MPDASPQRPQDDIDTRELTPAQRARRARVHTTLFVIALCAVCGVAGYMAGRGQRPRRRETVVESELQKPGTATTARPAPPPPPAEPLARLESVEATLEDTRVRVRFSTRVEKAEAEKAGAYAIEPEVMVIAAQLADDARTVTLTTSPLKHDVPYRLHVAGIEMLPATPDDRRATFRYAGTRRVRQGLLALYDFEEAEGEVVHDVSRVGEPLDLKIREPQRTTWVAGGIEVRESTLIHYDGDAAKITDACRESSALTVEAWLRPANTRQGGPSRIVTLSRGASTRNFTFGQEGANYHVRLRTTQRDANGEPAVASQGGVAEALTHVVYTRNVDGKAALWINGQLNASATVPGDFSNWTAFPLGLANEFDTDRTWLGQFHLVAVYARALTPDEIDQNFKAGPEGKTPRPERPE